MATLRERWFGSRAVDASNLRLQGGLPSVSGPFSSSYSLISDRVDVGLARALYRNVDPRYKLGAGFARPAVNVPVGFMGVPMFRVDAEASAQERLDLSSARWGGKVLRSHRALFRDGSVLVRLLPGNRSPAYQALYRGDDANWVDLTYHVADSFEVRTTELDITAVESVRIRHALMVEENGSLQERTLYEDVYSDRYEYEWEHTRQGWTVPNTLGFVPMVAMFNEAEPNELYGRSELEPVEPYMRFYHDVMMHAGSASQLHSTAKLIVRSHDVKKFLEQNFTHAEVTNRTLRFKGKEVLFFESPLPEPGTGGAGQPKDGAEIIQARAPLGDTNTLLEYIFLNIVDVTEVPEWAFGGAIASSKASVSEQSAPLVHKVERKRGHTTPDWELVGRVATAMLGTRAPVSVHWDDTSTKDTKTEGEALRARIEALVTAIEAELMSRETAVEDLRAFIPTLRAYTVEGGEGEADRIAAERVSTALRLIEELDSDATDEADRNAGIGAGSLG